MKVYLETLGCQMNRLDSELARGILHTHGHEMTDQMREAEVLLFNTCSVRDHAEQKVLSRLGAEDVRERQGKKRIVGVLGCMAQRSAKKLMGRFPCVNFLCGPTQLDRLGELIDQAAAGKRTAATDPPRGESEKRGQVPFSALGGFRMPGPPVGAQKQKKVPDPFFRKDERLDAMDLSRDPKDGAETSRAFVRVMRGCDRFCSYCIVPYVRGPEHSRSPDAIAEEVRRLVDAGRTEITLLGQTVNRYRHESGETTTRFSDLLARLSPTDGLRRLRFVTSHPLDFTRDLLEAMRDLPNVCEYIHCPAQSGSDAVLKRMNRGYTRAMYDEMIAEARQIVPDAVFVGDFIVGFPGETQEDHAASVDLIGATGYRNSFIFQYSPRPGTTAAKRFADDVPTPTKRKRNNELLAIQKDVGLAHHRTYVGKTMEVLVAGLSPRWDKQPEPARADCVQLTGRTQGDHVVIFDGTEAMIGQYIDVEILNAGDLTLSGRTV